MAFITISWKEKYHTWRSPGCIPFSLIMPPTITFKSNSIISGNIFRDKQTFIDHAFLFLVNNILKAKGFGSNRRPGHPNLVSKYNEFEIIFPLNAPASTKNAAGYLPRTYV